MEAKYEFQIGLVTLILPVSATKRSFQSDPHAQSLLSMLVRFFLLSVRLSMATLAQKKNRAFDPTGCN